MPTKKESSRTKNFNYRIARYFLENHRLMILSLIFISVIGVVSAFSLKTTGFPEPAVNVVLVQTAYPGAAADTVNRDITQPLEGAIKDIDGIATYESRSINGISIINISIDEEANPNDVRNQIESGVNGVELPQDAITPEVRLAKFDNADIILSIADTDTEKIYRLSEKITAAINEIPETATVTPLTPLQRVLVIRLNTKKLTAQGLTQADIEQQINSIGETIPVAGDVKIQNQNQTITTTFENTDLQQVKNMVIDASQEGSIVRLQDVAHISVEYRFTDSAKPYIGVRAGNDTAVLPALTLQISAADDTNLQEYTAQVREIVSTMEGATFITASDEMIPDNSSLIVENYTSDEFNQRQVDEVVSGLIGGELPIDAPWSYLGWLLGGIQLVFLVMLAFVSWRAAVVSTIAIPLSLIFSTIYLYVIGEDLNTLVLFSLVLVIGLVVDPTLVILESIQRKIDIGLKGKQAALAAVADVGPGLFLASLTNIIVFLPFGLISGVLGQIFAYIPLTVVPAVIGSYVVPLIFLGWIGGLFLKKNKKSSQSEEENLWWIARFIIRLNTRLLQGSVIIRCVVIFIAFILPIAVTGYYFTTKHISVVQFSSSDNGDFLQIAGIFKSTTPQPVRHELEKSVITTALENSAVTQVYPITDDFQYIVNLQSVEKRGSYLSTQINNDIEDRFEQKRIREQLFDLTSKVNSVGPPAQSYQISLAVSGADLTTLQNSAISIGKTMQQLCEKDNTFFITESCQGNRVITKVDDGITDKTNQVIEIVLNRKKLAQTQLTIPNAPLSALVNQFIRQYFAQNITTPLTTIQISAQDTDVVIEQTLDRPKTITEIKNIPLVSTPFATVYVKDVATVRKTIAPQSIRRVNGQTIAIVQGRIAEKYNDQTTVSIIIQTVLEYYTAEEGKRLQELSLPEDSLTTYSEGDSAAAARSFQDLFITLILAIVLSYIVLVLFFKSFTSPLVILFSIPLSFLGIFPALAHLSNGQFGFLEIIGLIILIGIVENVAIFLIDAANQKMQEEGWDQKRAIAYASGVRLRPVLLTKCTALASLAPLAILSETYRPISIVIMFGLLTSGLTSLITTPILYIFFRWLSAHYYATQWWNKILFFFLFPFYIIGWWASDHRYKKENII